MLAWHRFTICICCFFLFLLAACLHTVLKGVTLLISFFVFQIRTVVSCVLNTSHGMYSSIKKRDDEKRSILISLGVIDVDIPQHPVALHCMMTRSSKTLSKQLSEIQSQRSVVRYVLMT